MFSKGKSLSRLKNFYILYTVAKGKLPALKKKSCTVK